MLKDNQTRTVEAPHLQANAKNGSPGNDRANQPVKKSSASQWVIIAVLLAIAVVATLWLMHRREAAKTAAAARSRNQGPVPIVAGTAKEKNVPIYLDGLGTVQAYYTVTVRSRVDGQLTEVAFTEGQDVKKGDLLVQIDPAPYQAALDQAKGKKGQDQAQLANAELDLKREENLYKAKIDTEQTYATQKSLVAQLTAAVKADEAAIEAAQVNLNYTRITSPITGRTGIRQIDPGNIVHATDSNGVVVVTQLKPISVIFTLPEQTLSQIHQAMTITSNLSVLAVDRDNNSTLDTGALSVIDNQIDTSTGTIKLKANFPNEKLALWPGQFVNARLLVATRTNGVVVPAVAVQRGPEGAYVFVVESGPAKPAGQGADGSPQAASKPEKGSDTGDGDKTNQSGATQKKGGRGGQSNNQGGGDNLIVKIRPVHVAQIEAGEALIDSGLKVGERIVVDGQYKLQDGSPVKLSSENAVEKSSGAQTESTGTPGTIQ
jgi:multidrug efflux system membrane fusion protein